MNGQSGSPDLQSPSVIDRGFTIRVSIASLLVGLLIATPVGLILLALGQPATFDAEGGVEWSLRMLMLPLAAVVTVGILYWSIFRLPLRIARRRGIILDPDVWPWTGALMIGVVTIVGFIGLILAGVI
jgi:hypothetical protein